MGSGGGLRGKTSGCDLTADCFTGSGLSSCIEPEALAAALLAALPVKPSADKLSSPLHMQTGFTAMHRQAVGIDLGFCAQQLCLHMKVAFCPCV